MPQKIEMPPHACVLPKDLQQFWENWNLLSSEQQMFLIDGWKIRQAVLDNLISQEEQEKMSEELKETYKKRGIEVTLYGTPMGKAWAIGRPECNSERRKELDYLFSE